MDLMNSTHGPIAGIQDWSNNFIGGCHDLITMTILGNKSINCVHKYLIMQNLFALDFDIAMAHGDKFWGTKSCYLKFL